MLVKMHVESNYIQHTCKTFNLLVTMEHAELSAEQSSSVHDGLLHVYILRLKPSTTPQIGHQSPVFHDTTAARLVAFSVAGPME